MGEIFSLLDELNIDEAFKEDLVKLSNLINEQIEFFKESTQYEQKISHLNFAYFLVTLIEDCYPNNANYQSLIKFIKDDIESYQYLVKKNFSNPENDKPVIH